MPVELNHTIVHASDRQQTADFLSDVLGLPAPEPYGPFLVVRCANGVSLDVMEVPGPFESQHYAFLVTDEEFDRIHDRIVARGLDFWADPFHNEQGRVNDHDGGKGVYWSAPDGHNLEIITVPYGGA
jgi:catechol 2,3-dioxygenase-like lactoylglutathione lyase family enzyme